jgi:class 3 adenylate cyclase
VGDGTAIVSDIGSSNGTFANGERVDQPRPVAVGDVVTLGETEITLTLARPDLPAIVLDSSTGPSDHLGAKTLTTPLTTIDRVVAATVGEDLVPTLLGSADEPGTLTLVFSDIEGSTSRALALGDEAWLELLRRHNRLLTTHVAAHRGRVVKTQGDGFMLAFRSARHALMCAIGVQQDLQRWADARPDEALRVRMGLHTGEVLVDDGGDLFGKHVIVAARVASGAEGGEILVSDLVKRIAEPRGDIAFSPARTMELKGLEAEEVYAVDWRSYVGATAVT